MKRFCLLLLSLLATTAIWGQTAVSGVVQDSSGQPIVGAGVVQVGSATNGVMTNLDGAFSISVPAGSVLEISCVGYVTKRVTVESAQSNLTIVLDEDSEMLDDVVVVAFGKMKREAFTGSAATIKAEELT